MIPVDVSFLVQNKTYECLAQARSPVIFLVGGFNGFYNFGDILQLLNILHQHQRLQPDAILCPLIHPSGINDNTGIHLLDQAFGNQNWIFYQYKEETEVPGLKNIPVKVLDVSMLRTPVKVHFYGGGRLNDLWGYRTIRLIEALLASSRHPRYFITGQQVSWKFTADFEAHIRKTTPKLIACRDQLSIDFLKHHGIHAEFSGDDSIEYLSEIRDRLSGSSRKYCFGFQITTAAFASEANSPSEQTITRLDRIVQDLGKNSNGLVPISFLAFAFAEIQGIYFEKNRELSRQLYPIREINLGEKLVHGQLQELSPEITSLKVAVVMSYHIALYFKLLGIPVYLLGFNDYYHQKQASIGQRTNNLQSFMKSWRLPFLRYSQERWVRNILEQRKNWMERFDLALLQC